MQSIPRVGLLLPHHRCPNLGCIPNPKLVSQLGQHLLEPLRVTGCLHAYAHWLLQPRVKLLCLTVPVFESAFSDFAGFCIHHRNLLKARMKITAYNQHARLLSSRVLVRTALPSLLGSGRSRRCYPIRAPFTPKSPKSIPSSVPTEATVIFWTPL